MITGANRGLGKAIALAFAREGAHIVSVSRETSHETSETIHSYGVQCLPIQYDLSDVENIDTLISQTVEMFGTIDILVNNAGAQVRYPCAEFPLKDWLYIMNVNCNSVFFLCQKAGRIMIEKGYGKIINIASMLSFQGGFTVPAYAASKGAVMQFTKSLSNEWASLGVNVNCLAPGYFDTELNVNLVNDPNRSRQILERIPIGRWGRPDDITGTAVYLASDASDFVNGIILPVDGGWLGR